MDDYQEDPRGQCLNAREKFMASGINGDGELAHSLDHIVREITAAARGDNEQLLAFLRAFNESVSVPCDGFVIGEPVSVVKFGYDGKQRRGLTALCRRENGGEHIVAAADVVLPHGSSGAFLIAAYRRWLGLESLGPGVNNPSRRARRHKAIPSDLDLSHPVELVVLSVSKRAARCRLPGTERIITLRAGRIWTVVPGYVAVIRPRKQWNYAGHPYLSGEIQSAKLDLAALGLTPLELRSRGTWNPDDEYWGEEQDPIEEWAKTIIARGPRQQYEMEQILPGMDPDGIDSDPICESNDLKDAGDREAAEQILMQLCEADLRCLDAHAHLGNLVFEHSPKDALRQYEVGFRIGELSLGPGFDGVLPWGFIDNRPFLRCMNGFGLCLWRLGRFEEAEHIFDRMLWLNPSDNQGVRFLIDEVRERRGWHEEI
jgi:tetratricopeptide (TPR) repeat protein